MNLLNLLPIRMFKSESATGHVYFVRKGTFINKGLGYSGLRLCTTIVAVVPTTPLILNFQVNALTKDSQAVTVAGTVTVELDADIAVEKLDFTVDADKGGYIGNWSEVLQSIVKEEALRAVNGAAGGLNMDAILTGAKTIEAAVKDSVTTDLDQYGINKKSCSVEKPVLNDRDVAAAIGAKERADLLKKSDLAVHERRKAAAENTRALGLYEAETNQQLEKAKEEAIKARVANEELLAKGEADATKIRLLPFDNAEPGRLLGIALMKAAEAGGSWTVTTDTLAALTGKRNGGDQ